MQRTTDLIRALNTTARRPRPAPTRAKQAIATAPFLIHHDNMLEGRRFRTEEIAQALRNQDDEVVVFRPLMARIAGIEMQF